MADLEVDNPDNAPIVVDDTASELDSAFGDGGSDTTSLASSILKYHFENGRRYQSFREGRYLLPNDEKEQDHMDIMGHMFKLVLDGRLYLAPIGDNPQRILDMGCGTGLWAIEMGVTYFHQHRWTLFPQKYYSAWCTLTGMIQVIGNDLSPIQPQMVPPNVQFEVDDIEEDWLYKSPFDFIHARFLASSIRNWPRLFQQTFRNLKPGGYAEFFDYNPVLQSDDGSLKKDHDMNINMELAAGAANIIGQDAYPGTKLKKWAEDAGFVNIKEHVFKLPFGTWPKDPRMKEIGAWNQLQSLEGIDGWSMGLLTRVHGWSPEEVQVHVARARKDYRNPAIHSYVPMHLVYGQKPEKEK